jgi:hypothetical protein
MRLEAREELNLPYLHRVSLGFAYCRTQRCCGGAPKRCVNDTVNFIHSARRSKANEFAWLVAEHRRAAKSKFATLRRFLC